jgi:hypothetical protein
MWQIYSQHTHACNFFLRSQIFSEKSASQYNYRNFTPKKKETFEKLSTLHTKAVARNRQRHYTPRPSKSSEQTLGQEADPWPKKKRKQKSFMCSPRRRGLIVHIFGTRVAKAATAEIQTLEVRGGGAEGQRERQSPSDT